MSQFDCSGELAQSLARLVSWVVLLLKALRRLAQKFWLVAATLNVVKLRVDAIVAAGGKAAFVKVDASDRKAVEAARDAIQAEHGMVTCW